MLDRTTIEGKAVVAALQLASERPWADVTLRDIADTAGLSLADLRGHVESKAAILTALLATVDDHVLRTAPRPDMAEAPRDRLFEVLMSRFDALAPHKAGLKSIAAAAPLDASLIKHALSSQAWMLQAAGIGADGVSGGIKTLGLASLYAQVFKVWLEDDDPGLARTMAALDRRLRGGERAIAGVDDALKVARRFADTLGAMFRRSRVKPASEATSEDKSSEPPPSVQPAAPTS